MLDLAFPNQRSIIVTGGASGIGQATATMAAAAGLRVAVWDVTPCPPVGDGGISLIVDLNDESAVSRAMDTTRAHFADDAPSAYLVANGGPPAGKRQSLSDGTAEIMRCVGFVTECFLAGELPEGAAVVATASIAGNLVASGSPWYGAGKAAIAGWVRFMAVRHGHRVRFNSVAPGITETPRTLALLDGGGRADLAARCPLQRPGRAEEIAGAILFLLSPLASYVNGVLLPVDGGLSLHQ